MVYALLIASNTGNEVLGFALLLASALLFAAWGVIDRKWAFLALQGFYIASAIMAWFAGAKVKWGRLRMYLGLDLGTSSLKGIVVDDDQGVVAVGSVPLSVQRPHPGWSEQDPAEWIAACRELFRQLSTYLSQIKAIGIAGHMHGVVLLDEGHHVLRPCILWNDTRSEIHAVALDEHPAFRQISGTIVFPGFWAPKLAWLQNHERELWQQVRKVLFPKDYLAFWLTGVMQTEPSDAAGSALFDGEAGQWSATLRQLVKIEPSMLPPVIDSDAPRGTVLDQHCQEFAFPPSCVVAGGAGDNAAASIGIGALKKGQGQVSLGTSGVLLLVNDTWAPEPETAVHTFNHAVTDHYIQMGVTLMATDSLNWLANSLGKTPEQLSGDLPSTLSMPDPERDLLFLPFLAGERTPYNLGHPQGGFVGLSQHHGPTDMTRAVMEGVCYSLADCADALAATGATASMLVAVGGGVRSPQWVQMLADVLNCPLSLDPRAQHAAALGAARLGIAAERQQPIANICAQAPMGCPHAVIEPRADFAVAYASGFARYKRVVQAVLSA